MEKIFVAIDGFFARIERRTGLAGASLLTGLFLLSLAMVFSAVRFETFHHGNAFTRLSIQPFGHDNPNDLRLRILSPLLGYILFFRGVAFKYFMLIILAFFIGSLYYYFRKKNLRASESFGITALLAFSTLTFYQLFFPAYTDPMSFLLIVLFMIYNKNKFASTILLSLLLFNHENTFFILPFLFLYDLENDFSFKRIITVAFRFAVAVIPYIIYRKIMLQNEEIEYNASYYLDPNNIQWTKEHVLPHLASGIFQAFRLTWLIPLTAFVINLIQSRHRENLLILAGFAVVLCQMIVAYDISRLMGLSFPIILISALRIREYAGSKKLLMLVFSIFILNLFIPSYCIGALDPISLKPLWMN
jgi:hypothetical protein